MGKIRREKGGRKKGERERGSGKWVMVGTRGRYQDRERWEK